MGKFTTSQRAIIGSNCTSAIQKSGNKKQVMVTATSAEAGQTVAGIIQSAYPGYKVYKAENRFAYTLEFGLSAILGPIGTAATIAHQTWKSFTVATDSQAAAKKLVTEINDCIDDYGETPVDVNSGSYTGNGSNGSGIGKTAVYLAVGVVLAVVIAIVLT